MNDLEKKLRKRGMKKLDKFAHNPYHVNKPSFFSRIPLWTKIAIPAVAMTAVTFVASISLISRLGSHATSPASMSNQGEGTYYSTAAPAETSQDKAMNSNSSSTWLHGGGDYTTPEGYPAGITFQGAQYNFLYNSPARTGADYGTISADKLGNVIGETTGETTITVYEIQNYSSKAFIAMKFSNSNVYYVAVNSHNVYSTLDDFLTQTSFASEGILLSPVESYRDGSGKTTRYKTTNDTSVNEYLFADISVANDVDGYKQQLLTPGDSSISMSFKTSTFDIPCIFLTLHNSGYLTIRVGDTQLNEVINAFNIGGLDKYVALLNYVETLTPIDSYIPHF